MELRTFIDNFRMCIYFPLHVIWSMELLSALFGFIPVACVKVTNWSWGTGSNYTWQSCDLIGCYLATDQVILVV